MKTILMGLLAETSIHPGAGRSLGAVDLPVAREAATDYPVLVGSSLKGALRDNAADHLSAEQIGQVYGVQDHAGGVVVSDGRLVLLPVRSLTGSYRWVTCPHILERLFRDFERAGVAPGFEVPAGLEVREGETPRALSADDEGASLFLEERQFRVVGAPDAALIEALGRLVHYAQTRARLARQVVVLADSQFAWFVRYGLPVQARNQLHEHKKTSENLWYEESLPPDTVMSALIAGRDAELLGLVRDQLNASSWLQTGGNETVGQGTFRLCLETSGRGGES